MTNPLAREVTLRRRQEGVEHWAREIMVWCPGCESPHRFTVELSPGFPTRANGEPEPVWSWNGSLDNPSFEPSLLCFYSVRVCKSLHTYEVCEDYENCNERSHHIMNYYETVDESQFIYAHESPCNHNPIWGNCHSFLRNATWDFLGDSAHQLRGLVPMVPLPEALMSRPF